MFVMCDPAVPCLILSIFCTSKSVKAQRRRRSERRPRRGRGPSLTPSRKERYAIPFLFFVSPHLFSDLHSRSSTSLNVKLAAQPHVQWSHPVHQTPLIVQKTPNRRRQNAAALVIVVFTSNAMAATRTSQ